MRSEISQRVKYNTEKSVNLGYSKALFQKTKIKSIFFQRFQFFMSRAEILQIKPKLV